MIFFLFSFFYHCRSLYSFGESPGVSCLDVKVLSIKLNVSQKSFGRENRKAWPDWLCKRLTTVHGTRIFVRNVLTGKKTTLPL